MWHVRDFKLELVAVNPEEVTFFSGDSYLVLNVEGAAPNHYYWIGSETTADEAGTAAYKAFELDNIFNGAAIQCREVCGGESERFRKLFPSMKIVEGGAASGFHHVEKVAPPRPRLLRISLHNKENARLPLDVNGAYILDLGNEVYQWIGSSDPKVKYKTMQEVLHLDDSPDSSVTVNVIESMNEFENIVRKSGACVPRITVWSKN